MAYYKVHLPGFHTLAEVHANIAENRKQYMAIPWRDRKAIVNLFRSLEAAADVCNAEHQRSATEIAEITAVDMNLPNPAHTNDYFLKKHWIADETVEITLPEKTRVFLVYSKQHPTLLSEKSHISVVTMHTNGHVGSAFIETQTSNEGWALEIRDRLAALLR